MIVPKLQKAMRKLSFESLQKAAQYSKRVVESNTSREFTLAPPFIKNGDVRNPSAPLMINTSHFHP
jgi:hypothetical protein